MSDRSNDSTINSQLAALADALFKPGQISDFGWPEGDLKGAIQLCLDISIKPYCAIKDWTWWDLNCGKPLLELINAQSLLPCVVKSNHVIEDEAKRFLGGNWMRSGLLVQFHHNAIFETRNTLYILVGPGTRKSVDLATVNQLF